MPFGQVIQPTGLNLGYPGTFSRMADSVTASRPVLSTAPHSIFFGQAVVIVPTAGGGDSYESVADFIAGGGSGANALAQFAGIAIREVTTMKAYPVNPDSPQNGGYAPGTLCEAAERGSIPVVINVGTPQSQGQVYMRVMLNGAIPAGVIGGLEAAADGANTVALPGVVFRTGVLDANNVAEITLKSRSAA